MTQKPNSAEQMARLSEEARQKRADAEEAADTQARAKLVEEVRLKHLDRVLEKIRDSASRGGRELEYLVDASIGAERRPREEANALAELLRAEGFEAAADESWINSDDDDSVVTYQVHVSW
jgi:hypothetical protein